MDEIRKARAFAKGAHIHQLRDDEETPYFAHVERVAAMVVVLPGAHDAMVVAAYLHDVVEDTIITLAFVRDMFGDRVADMVDHLTNKFTKADYPDLNRVDRKKKEHERLARVPMPVKLIKMVDRIDNLRDLLLDNRKRRAFARVYLEETADLMVAMLTDADVIHEATLYHLHLIVDHEIKRIKRLLADR